MGINLGIKKERTPDSEHERWFDWWAQEAIEHGFVKECRWATSFTLTPTKKIGDHKLFGELHYTPDFIIHWNGDNQLHRDINLYDPKQKEFFISQLDPITHEPYTIIDIKPDRSERYRNTIFIMNQKLMYTLWEIYVQKVVLIPASNSRGDNRILFRDTWNPKKFQEEFVYKTNRNGKGKWNWKKGDSRITWDKSLIEDFIS